MTDPVEHVEGQLTIGTCHFCGADVDTDGGPCHCMTPCVTCRHIGHEHSSVSPGKGICRGTNYDVRTPDGRFAVEPCEPHLFVAIGPLGEL